MSQPAYEDAELVLKLYIAWLDRQAPGAYDGIKAMFAPKK